MAGDLKVINFIIVGGGWRAEFYLRIAQALPDVFSVSAICIRNPERAREIQNRFHVKVVNTIDDALQAPFDFIVNCINKDDISELSIALADRGCHVLAETPVTKPLIGNHHYERIQIAEQFHLKGTYQAIKTVIDSGIIGKIVHINLSVAHGYHAMSLFRFLLDEYAPPELLESVSLPDTVFRTNGRLGKLPEKKMVQEKQTIKIYQFQSATAVYDYNTEQYFSPIRKDRLLIRGTRGEIENKQVRYLNENDEFVCSEMRHMMSGLLDGFYNDRIVFEHTVLYDYPYKQARLSEEETAILEALMRMDRFVRGQEEVYSYQRAYEDYEFSMRMAI